MSKIYKALEKAEREREEGLKKGDPVTPEIEEEKIERHTIKSKPEKVEGISSDLSLSLYCSLVPSRRSSLGN